METIFFDLDGTLTDPKIGITRSIQYAMERLGREPPSTDELTWCIGPPLLDSFQQLVGERADEALHFYRDRFADTGWRENIVYPGVSDMLAGLAQARLLLHVATSKPWKFAEKILDHFEMRAYFESVYGAELDGSRSDKTELLRFALSQVKPLSTATMVGDRSHDVRGALNNGMAVIGVTYGYGSVEELKGAGARLLAGSPAEVQAVLSAFE